MKSRIPLLSCALLLLLAQCERNDQPLTDATGVFEKAVSYFEDHAYLQAESLFVRSLPVFEKSGQTYTVVEANRYLGQIAMAEGRFYSALRKFESALDLTVSLKDFRTEMKIRELIGDSYASLDAFQSALVSYREAHRLSSAFNDLEVKASLEMKMGEVSILTDHLDDAFALY